MSEKPSEDDVGKYLEILIDAARQRSSNEEMQTCLNHAKCIQDITDVLRKYQIKEVDDMVKILVSVMVVPLQMLEPNATEREYLMKKLALHFVQTILAMQKNDLILSSTESGNELDRLRHMIQQSGMFKL